MDDNYVLRTMLQQEAQRSFGKSYLYGCNGPLSFDCSALALHLLRSAGFNLADMTAADLRNKFKGCEINRSSAQVGDLYFYGKPKINHVCICYMIWDENQNYRLLIGANSGDSRTKTIKDAWNMNAFVKVVKDTYRLKDLNCIINPFKKFE